LGGKFCGKFVEERRNRHDILYPIWVTGYLTAVNVHTPTYDILGATDIDGAMIWLENYCNQNPLKDFSVAVDAIVNEIDPKRTTKAPK
jgi:hypothetical protein